jgi:ATP-dependent Clp protease ATP-binding subunit ClpA
MLSSSPEVEQIIKDAAAMADNLNHSYVTVEHLTLALLNFSNFNKCVKDFGCDVDTMLIELDVWLKKQHYLVSEKGTQPQKTYALERVFNRAFTQVIFHGRNHVQPADIFLAITGEDKSYSNYVFQKYGMVREPFVKYYNKNYREQKVTALEKYDPQQAEKILDEYCTNLNDQVLAGEIDPVIGRDSEIDEMIQVLGKRNKNNVLLVGDPGVGKTAIAEGLAIDVVANNVPEYLNNYTVYSLDVGTLLAGSKYRGEFEEKITEVLNALISRKKCILFIDEAHQMRGAGAGKESSVDMANMLKPAISKGKVKVVASTTWEEYSQSFEKDRALARRFYRLSVDEPTPAVAKDILRGLKKYFDEFHKCDITSSAVESAVDYSVRYMTDKKLPDKAIDLIDSAAAKLKKQGYTNFSVGKKEILAEVSRIVRIPIDQLDLDKQDGSIKDLDGKIKKCVYGQDHVIDGVVEKIFVAKAGLKAHDKPIGSFLFLGPTGVGKTELAKQLSDNLSMKLLRYDMSEFQEKHTVARLIGAPPGYVGFEDSNLSGGALVKDIEQNPNSIILFDEVEKAHPDVSNVLLQMMDEGFISSSNGKKADCRNCIILMTSNLGSADNERNAIGFGRDLQKTGEDDKAVKDYFRPEFRNRLDAVYKFNYLQRDAMSNIIDKFIDEVNMLLNDKGIRLHLESSAREYLLDNGFDPKMGARPLSRIINDKIKTPLSKMIIGGEIAEGTSLRVEVDNDTVTLTANNPAEVFYDDTALPSVDGSGLIVLDQFKPKD